MLLLTKKYTNDINELGYPPLLYACEQENNVEMLQLLFQEETIDPLATDKEGQIALHILAFKGQLELIKEFCKKFPNVPVDFGTLKRTTPLMMAAKMDHAEVIEYFCQKGADINHKNNKSYTALFYAANNGYTKSTKKLLELGADVNAEDDRKCTPLIKCCSWNFVETCKVLIENDAEVDKADAFLNTALVHATRRGFIKIIEILLQNGANPNFETKTEYLPYTPVVTACKNNKLDLLKILIKHGGNVNFPGEYSLPLINCIKTGFLEGVKVLIEAGVNLKGRHPQSGKTPLEQARKCKQHPITNLIQNSL